MRAQVSLACFPHITGYYGATVQAGERYEGVLGAKIEERVYSYILNLPLAFIALNDNHLSALALFVISTSGLLQLNQPEAKKSGAILE